MDGVRLRPKQVAPWRRITSQETCSMANEYEIIAGLDALDAISEMMGR